MDMKSSARVTWQSPSPFYCVIDHYLVMLVTLLEVKSNAYLSLSPRIIAGWCEAVEDDSYGIYW